MREDGTCPSGAIRCAPVRFRLIPRERSFFPLFEQAADNLHEATIRLKDELTEFADIEVKHKAVGDCEHAGDELTKHILRRLHSTYITPFDREDIHSLTERIDDVVDLIHDASELLVLHNIDVVLPELIEMGDLLEQAAAAATSLIKKLEGLRNLGPELEAIDTLESQADRIYRRTVAHLFSGDYDPRDILRWKDIVEALESAINGVEDIADVVHSIALKHA